MLGGFVRYTSSSTYLGRVGVTLNDPACMGVDSTWLEQEKGERGKIKKLPSPV